MSFNATVRAVRALPPTRRLVDGSHPERRETVGDIGQRAADVPFDVTEHEPSQIDPMSALGAMMLAPYVRQTQQPRHFHSNVVLTGVRQDEDPSLIADRQRAASKVAYLLHDALQRSGDTVGLHSLGGLFMPTEASQRRLRAKELDTPRDILTVCRTGLTFIVSDFGRELREGLRGNRIKTGVGVKVNFPAEIEVGPGMGILSLGGGREVDTSKPAQVDWMNEQLAAYQAGVEADITSTGMTVAQVLMTPHSVQDFAEGTADRDIAQAVKRLR